MDHVGTWDAFMDELRKEGSVMGHSLHMMFNRNVQNQAKQMNPRDMLDRRTVRRFRKPNPRFIRTMTSNTKFSK